MEKQADISSKRFLSFGANIVKLTKKIDTNQMHRHIRMQLFISTASTGVNYKEAIGAENQQDFSHKLQIVLKEACEFHYWLKLIKQSEILKNNDIRDLIEVNRQICYIIALKKNQYETN